jgi:hypothetical protein
MAVTIIYSRWNILPLTEVLAGSVSLRWNLLSTDLVVLAQRLEELGISSCGTGTYE